MFGNKTIIIIIIITFFFVEMRNVPRQSVRPKKI
jgi:hypothetical protein